jgi:hypothetical protein
MENANHQLEDTRTLDKKEKDYDRAITLIQYNVQLFWLVFSAFLLSETVLLGAIISIAMDDASGWMFAGSIFGLLLCLPWWTSFKYNHSFYQLRINEARNCEPSAGLFFSNGLEIIKGNKVLDVSLPKYAVALNPKRAVSLLIIMFVLAFLSIAISKNPWRTPTQSSPGNEVTLKASPTLQTETGK